MRLQVYIDGEYSYISEVENLNMTVKAFIKQIENEMSTIFDDSIPVKIAALQTQERCDVNPNYPVSAVFKDNDFVFILRALTRTVDDRVEPIILEIPERTTAMHVSELSQMDTLDGDQSLRLISDDMSPKASQPVPVQPLVPKPAPPLPAQSDRAPPCQPYCELTAFGRGTDPCPKCGEMRPYLPIEGQYCTELCVIRAKQGTGYVRKMKSQGLDFCSICISRYRHRKYTARQQHQCAECHRPWLILNEAGLCRTCHVKLAGRPSARKRKNDGY
ncbi:Cdc14 phosphatase binding protein N-terminus [Carpediemonas membranifera]|uniref:Cdc14 phosphatase binding protein N-terminus n=1 Tax=Carpediemonas membranifera TaxID=201153 RepID=A0A8J6AW71_9EUKA|nr:Cdc14 phosphatase binding protein N-terminus [Carpediemonas membranifera]|eukprot:KAG9395698.1 Cdc14 phosphatase binding protein N-terminus [Carpediemonas membranifera]